MEEDLIIVGKLISMPEFQEVENFPSKQDDLIELPTKK